jgi:pectin methylesterase-like acyl-CoA thioesterase
MRKILGLLIVSLLPMLWLAAPSFQQAQVIRYVSNTSPTCNGQAPCYSTIQAAINAAQPGDTIRIQAGTYTEAVLIKGKNAAVGATEADRIVIEADPTAPVGSVIVGTTAATCVAGTNLQIESSQFVTIRGLTITGGKGQALTLAGGAKKKNAAIHIERNRMLGNGTCKGGLLI